MTTGRSGGPIERRIRTTRPRDLQPRDGSPSIQQRFDDVPFSPFARLNVLGNSPGRASPSSFPQHPSLFSPSLPHHLLNPSHGNPSVHPIILLAAANRLRYLTAPYDINSTALRMNRSPSSDPPEFADRRSTMKPKVDLSCRCSGCGIDLARLIFRGKTDVPWRVSFHCLNCVPLSDEISHYGMDGEGSYSDTISAAVDRLQGLSIAPKDTRPRARRERTTPQIIRKVGEDTTICDVCARAIGSGGVFGADSRSQVEFGVEIICVACDWKYRRCTDCGGGGGGRLGVGKWRVRELFPDGRKTCQLSHLRLGSITTMKYDVWAVDDLPGSELDELLDQAQQVYFRQMFATLAIPEILETEEAMATTADEVEHLTLDFWTIVDSMLRQNSEPQDGVRRYMALRWSNPTQRKRKTHRDADPNSGDNSDGQEDNFNGLVRPAMNLAGFVIAEHDIKTGSLCIVLSTPWATGDTFDATTILMQSLLHRVRNDLDALNFERKRRGEPSYPALEKAWRLTFFKKDSKLTAHLMNRRGFMRVEHYLAKYPTTDPAHFHPQRSVSIPNEYLRGWHVLETIHIASNALSLVALAVAPAVFAQQTPLAKLRFTYPDIPQKVDRIQTGYNRCNSTTESQTSYCQTSWVNSLDDFCLWAPPDFSIVAEEEGEMVAWCTKPGHGTRLIPPGALQGVQWLRTPNYIQITGFVNQTMINLEKDDFGGELDPHGADQRGNPLGGIVFSSAFNATTGSSQINGSTINQVIEWTNFMGANVFCLKACDPAWSGGPDHYDRIGCAYNAPSSNKIGTFEECKADNGLNPGIFVVNGVNDRLLLRRDRLCDRVRRIGFELWCFANNPLHLEWCCRIREYQAVVWRRNPGRSPSGLAISYDFEAPQAPPPTSSSSHHRQQMRADSMGWDDSHDIPVPRDVTNKPFVQAYDPTTNTSSRVDSVLDAYSNMYSDFAEDEEDERDAEPEPEAQRREPWDTRGKTGLYGGGGRGADDSETGWVLDYSTDSTPSHQASRGRSGEEDLRYSDPATPKSRSQDFGYGDSSDERRRSSSGTTQSSYGPATPVNSAFDPMAGYQDSSPYRPIVAKAPAPLPSRIHRPSLTPDHPVMKNNRTRASFSNGPLPPHPSSSAPSSSSRAPARQSEPTRPYDSRPPPAPPRAEFVRQPISPPRAGDTSRLQKRSPPSVNRRPSISAPIPSPPSPQRPPDTTSPRATEDVKRRKSVSAGFKFGRSKKAPTISAPILPEGFVEALGMETFALSPGCSPPDHNTSPRAKKMAKDAAPAPRPRKQQLPGAMPGSPRPNTTVGSFAPRPPPQQPKQARPATDMYRSDHPAPGPAISITPHDDHDAFRRLSQNSDTSSHAPSVAAPGEADRRQYFKGLRDDRSRQPTEVQANRGSIPNRGIAPPLNLLQRRPSTATTIGGQSSRTVYAQPPPFTQPAYQAPPAQSSGKGDSFRDPWSKGNGGNSGGVRLPVPPNNYRDNNGYSAPNESPLGQYSGSDSDRGHSASDYSLSPSPSPTAFQEDYSPTVQSNYGNGNNHNNNHAPHHGYSSSYQPQSLNVQPLNLNARRGSSATVLKAPRESVVGDVVWKGQEPSPPPVPFRKSEKIGVGSNVFRNPFEAGGGGAGGGGGQVRSGWQ
ncbi:hypothetical protein RQP46_001267 [Phenoliferia psychrophenolica]